MLIDEMSAAEFRSALKRLGLTGLRAMRLAGVDSSKPQIVFAKWLSGEREVPAAVARLVNAYLDGYRPADWAVVPVDIDDIALPESMRIDGADLRAIREQFGFDRGQMGYMLGFVGATANDQIFRLECGERRLRAPSNRILLAYLDGYRPPDWGSRGLADGNLDAAMQIAKFELDEDSER